MSKLSIYRIRLKFFIAIILITQHTITPDPALGLNEEDWVKVFDQDFSKIELVPQNIQAIKTSEDGTDIMISKEPDEDYLLITKNKNDRGSVDIFGFTPSIKTRYIIDLEWTNNNSDSWSGSGVHIGVGGIRLYAYSSGGGSRFYLRGLYFNASNAVNVTFIWDLGISSRASIIVESDTKLGKAYIYYKNLKAELPFYQFFWGKEQSQIDTNRTAELPFYVYRWREDTFLNTFTPDTLGLTPITTQSTNSTDSTLIKLYRVTQEVYAPNSVVAIGSTKYQAFGYDGPHPADTVEAGMEEIRNAKMNATIFADVDYTNNEAFVRYLKGLIADGWELGIHYSEGLSTLSLKNSTRLMVDEYEIISNRFGTRPLTWCSLGNLDNTTYSLLAKNNLEMVFRSIRVIPQNVPGSTDITTSTINYWLGAAKSGAATVPIYVHQTEVEPQKSASSVGAGLFDAWLEYVITKGIRLTGFYKWYMINSNQIDAMFNTKTEGDNTTIKVDTNGYNAIILVKIQADSVIAVWHNGQIIDYSVSPEGYIIFEVEDNSKYSVTTIDYPDNLLDKNILLIFVIGLIICVFFVVQIYLQGIIKIDETAINDEKSA